MGFGFGIKSELQAVRVRSLEGYLGGRDNRKILELSEISSANRHHSPPSSKELYLRERDEREERKKQ